MKLILHILLFIFLFSCNPTKKVNTDDKKIETPLIVEIYDDYYEVLDENIESEFKLIKPQSPNGKDIPAQTTQTIENEVTESISEKTVTVNTKENIHSGTLTIIMDDTMTVGKKYIILIGVKKHINGLNIKPNTNSEKQFTIRVDNVMEVKIIDPTMENKKSFYIVENGRSIQIIEDEEWTWWRWDVWPLSGGKKELNIVVSIVKDGGVKTVVFSNKIEVIAKPIEEVKKFWFENWKWVFTTAIIPMFIFIFNRIRNKKRK